VYRVNGFTGLTQSLQSTACRLDQHIVTHLFCYITT